MKISTPYIRKEHKYMVQYINLWENFIAQYNDNDNKRSSCNLKPIHREAYFKLISLVKAQLIKNRMLFKDTPDMYAVDSREVQMVRTTRANIAKALGGVSESTAYRALMRLQKAGVIEKVFCSDTRPFEVYINPDFLLIYDYDKDDYIPQTQFFQTTETGECKEVLRSICTHCSCVLMSLSNNKIIPVSDVNNVNTQEHTRTLKGVSEGNISLHEHTRTHENTTRNTPKQNENEENKKEKSCAKKEKSCAKKENNEIGSPVRTQFGNDHDRNSIEWYKRSYAIVLLQYMMHILFRNHNVYFAEKQRTLDYIEQNYFCNITSPIGGEKLLNRYMWRVDAAKRYIERKNYNFANIYPYHYVDINNRFGFISTDVWKKDNDKYQEHKQKVLRTRNKQNIDRQNLARVVKNFNENPDIETFSRGEAYVKQNIPHLHNEYLLRTTCAELIN